MSYINRRGRDSAWRGNKLRSLLPAFIIHERIETTPNMARNLTKILSKLITLSKRNDLHSRRLSLRYLNDKDECVHKLFTSLRERYLDRKGGYVRTNKLGYRRGDNSLRVIVSLV